MHTAAKAAFLLASSRSCFPSTPYIASRVTVEKLLLQHPPSMTLLDGRSVLQEQLSSSTPPTQPIIDGTRPQNFSNFRGSSLKQMGTGAWSVGAAEADESGALAIAADSSLLVPVSSSL